MRPEWRSPIPYLAALVGLGLGAVAGVFAGFVMGPYVCEDCHDGISFTAILIGTAIGAGTGAVGGVAAGSAAARRGPRAKIIAAGVLGFLLAGGAGAWAATEVWQRTHPDYLLRAPRPCRKDVRPDWCFGPRGHDEAIRVPRRSRKAVPGVTAAGGILAGGVGAATGAVLQRAAIRHRAPGREREPVR